MAILLSTASGKTVETNRATLQRLAAAKGDTLKILPVLGHQVRYDTVMLNGKTVGLLFDSHENAIAYLTKKVTRARPMAMANPKHRKRRGVAKKNPGVVKQKMTAKEMALTPHNLSKDGKFAYLKNGAVFIWDDRFNHWAGWKGAAKGNPITTGTSYFPTRHAAIRYYRSQGYTSAAKAVEQKIAAREIHIGKPPLKPGQTAYIDREDGRYFITG